MDQCGLLDITTDYGSAPVCWGGYVGKLVYEVCQNCDELFCNGLNNNKIRICLYGLNIWVPVSMNI